jgi:HD-GYP domain-containing protein (c-di-GMP phosphodiesterase class II)
MDNLHAGNPLLSNNLLAAIVEQSVDGVLLIDAEGAIKFANPAAVSLFASKTHNLVGYSLGVPASREITEIVIPDGAQLCYVEMRSRDIIWEGRTASLANLRDISKRKRVEEQLLVADASLKQQLQGTLQVIQQMTETHDGYTAGHQRRVAELSVSIARQMGLPEESCVSLIQMAASIHDVGKIAVPAEILSKPGRLSQVEFELIKCHPQAGYDILKRAELPYPVPETVLQHHERYDGTGYPSGLSGDDILPEASIVAVADVVEAMSAHRPYRPALGIDAALEELSTGSGTRYYPDVVAACIAVFRENGFAFSG